MIFDNGDLWERIISQIKSSTTRQVFKDHMTIDKVSDSEVFLIHDNNMIAKTMLEKERKEIEALLEKELGKKVTLNIQGLSRGEYFQRLMGIDYVDYNGKLYKNTEDKIGKEQNKTEKCEDNEDEKENILKLFFFDTETTGRDRQKHYIIQFGGIAGELNTKTLEFKESTRINQFINPPINENEFDKKAIETHHIHKKDLLGYSNITGYIHGFLKLIKDADYVIGHNVDFDKNFLIGECKRNKIKFNDSEVKWIDTMKPSKEIVNALDKRGRIKNPKLIELHTYLFGKGFDGAHDAMADITATKDCFIELIKKYGLFREILNKDKKKTLYQITKTKNENNYDIYTDKKNKIVSALRRIDLCSEALESLEENYQGMLELMKRNRKRFKGFLEVFYKENEKRSGKDNAKIEHLIGCGFSTIEQQNRVIKLISSFGKEYYRYGEQLCYIFEKFLNDYVEIENSYIGEINEINYNVSTEEDEHLNVGNNLIITPDSVPFSKFKALIEIISLNPGNITIQVFGNEMKVSKKGLYQLKKLIEE